MDSIVSNYRKKHPRCRYCKYDRIETDPLLLRDFRICKAKDKALSDMKAYYGGMFCSCFAPREDEG